MRKKPAPNPFTLDDFSLTPTPPRREPRLTNVKNVTRELGALYREGLNGVRPVHDVSRLAHVLAVLGKLMADYDLERRIEELEKASLPGEAP